MAEGIPGRISNYLDPPVGCRFVPRCPFAAERCYQEDPLMREIEGEHFVRCHKI
jgi:peptide/nickel transport system ATP-binding protein